MTKQRVYHKHSAEFTEVQPQVNVGDVAYVQGVSGGGGKYSASLGMVF